VTKPGKKAAPRKRAAKKIKAREIEGEYTLYVLVKVDGFGLNEHKFKQAGRVKRVLQTAFHQTVQCFVVDFGDDNKSLDTLTEQLREVSLDDRNALAGWDEPPRAE
jgi:hypothetical protein